MFNVGDVVLDQFDIRYKIKQASYMEKHVVYHLQNELTNETRLVSNLEIYHFRKPDPIILIPQESE